MCARMRLSVGNWWRRTDLEQSQDLSPQHGLEDRLDGLDRAFGAELTGSMSLNVRGTALTGGSAIAILLLAAFASTWLDDNRWQLPDVYEFAMKKVLLPGSIVTLVLCIVIGTLAVWPRRGWAHLQHERLRCMASGDRANEARLLLEMVERERASNERKGRLLRLSSVPLALATALVVAQCMVFAFKADAVDPPRTDEPAELEPDPVLDISKERQAELAAQYSPRVWLHDDDDWGPIAPEAFIEGSKLVWHRPNGDETVVERGHVDPARLGRNCGLTLDGCYEHENYFANELTRPFHGGRRRPRDLNRGRGFSLVPNEEAQEGDTGSKPPKVPMFYDVRRTPRALLITYWFYYGYSRPNAAATRVVRDVASHDGDWENIEVALTPDGSRARSVLFYGHGAPDAVPWAQVCKVGAGDTEVCDSPQPGRPVVFSALQSHASYHEAGRRTVKGEKGSATDVTARGRPWDPSPLLRVRDQPWYGFGGAWGRAKDPDGTTGPLGPSEWKLPADPDPGDLASEP
jgi:hypothetical protein